MNFRYDINGLRAIAVLAVVLFHFKPQWLPGGFAGVDVFFVISGFLMTSIIFNGVEKDSFNLFKFYNARANRIIPVLAAVSTVLIVFGWFYLLPTDYSDLGKQIEKSALFISNLLFAEGGGYFDTAEHTKWLLHTWSLSVEWQFYIFFPIIIITLKKYLNFTNLKRAVISLFIASFIFSMYATYKDSKTAYFLLTSRAWEMLFGGLAFLYPWSLKNKLQQISTQCFGLILIGTSYFLISKDTPWPGYMALIPVLGAYLIIVSNYQNNLLISNPIFSYIGKWSYSIYVWHWPLAVFGFYFVLPDWWMYGIPLSILLGCLSYQLIEKINFPRYSSWREIYKITPLYIFLIILACGYIIKETDGMKFHYSDKVLSILSEVEDMNPYDCNENIQTSNICKIGNYKKIKAIVIGDSHATALSTSVSASLNLNHEGILFITNDACPLLLDAQFRSHQNKCAEINQKRFNFINSKKFENVPIILIARFPLYIDGETDPSRRRVEDEKPAIYFNNDLEMPRLKVFEIFSLKLEETFCQITKTNPLYIVQPIPEMPNHVPKMLARNQLLGTKFVTSVPYIGYMQRSRKFRDAINFSAQRCNAKVLDPAKILCKNGECISQFNGRPIYRDGDHLSEYGNKLLTPIFKEILNK